MFSWGWIGGLSVESAYPAEDLVSVPNNQHDGAQPSITPVDGEPMPFSDLYVYQAHIGCSDLHIGKIPIDEST